MPVWLRGIGSRGDAGRGTRAGMAGLRQQRPSGPWRPTRPRPPSPRTGQQREAVRAVRCPHGGRQHRRAQAAHHVGQRRVAVQQDVRRQLGARLGGTRVGRVGHARKCDAAAALGGTAQHRRLHGPRKRVQVKLRLRVGNGRPAQATGRGRQ